MHQLRVAVTGSDGQLGQHLCSVLGPSAIALSRADLDLTKPSSIEQAMRHYAPDVVVNTAAYTQVDRAESDAEQCFAVNAGGVEHLAGECAARDCALIQLSSDYVFDDACADAPFRESDVPRARGVYALSKLAGERAAATCPKHFIVRTCGLYSLGPSSPDRGRNFVDTMLCLAEERDSLSIVDDQHCTPTFIPHLSAALIFLMTTEAYGTYHVTNSGATTWFHFAEELFRAANLRMRLSPISTAAYGAPAPRPAYSVLDLSKYQALGGPEMPTWQQGLSDYLQHLEALR